jgi:TrmH family RNA methyltransferase
LYNKRVRYREGSYLVEGYRVVAQALSQDVRLASLFFTPEQGENAAGRALLARAAERGIACYGVTPQVMATIADTVTPQGLLAVAEMPTHTLALAAQADLVLVLDDLRDPGNLGTILRTAQATGVGAVLLSEACADVYAPKVVRAAMGAHFRLPLWPDMAWDEIGRLVAGKACLLADPRDGALPWALDWRRPTALIVSSEAHGASEPAQALASERVSLPMRGEVESLNAAIATAVLLFEALRQRSI